MFCVGCGKELAEGAAFCPACGTKAETAAAPEAPAAVEQAPVEAAAPAPAATPEPAVAPESAPEPAPAAKKSRKLFAVLAGALVVVAAIVVAAILLFGGRSVNALVGTYVDASLTGDGGKVLDLIPKDMLNYVVDAYYDGDKSELIDEFDDEFEYMKESLDEYLGKGWTYSYKITEEEDWDKEELDDFVDDVRDEISSFSASAGKDIEIELTISSKDGEDYDTETMYISVIKCGSKWYLADFS